MNRKKLVSSFITKKDLLTQVTKNLTKNRTHITQKLTNKMNEPIIRELKKEDLWNEILTTLDSLRQTSDINKDKAEKILIQIQIT